MRVDRLRYELFFSVPREREKPVTGRVTVRFALEGRRDLWLDFLADGPVGSLNVNGTAVPPQEENGHILLPRYLLQSGENTVELDFTAPDRSLNRREDFLYTLLVPDRARTLFPCFDQPDLKAVYDLTLEVPSAWRALSGGSVLSQEPVSGNPGRTRWRFAPTEPLSTYLFSFVAGQFRYASFAEGERRIGILYREEDPAKTAQLPDIAAEVFRSLAWLEDYTGILYPFAKYDLAILPGFQYGGMEHTGATLYNDRRMWLEENASLEDRLERSTLIAHETAHMWFGDLVTMAWFDEVWTKEVFANYFAAEMMRELYPGTDDRLTFTSYHRDAYAEDRTGGAVPVCGELDNLQDAGLIYSNTIYCKAPVVMRMLAQKTGAGPFREGIREYLRTYAYGNASWQDLIRLLDARSDEDLTAWSRVWTGTAGRPRYDAVRRGDTLRILQSDPLGRGICWEQPLVLRCWGAGLSGPADLRTEVRGRETEVLLPAGTDYVCLNADAMGYGLFAADTASRRFLLAELSRTDDVMLRRALLTDFHELLLEGELDPDRWTETLLRQVAVERNDLLFAQALSSLMLCYDRFPLAPELEAAVEPALMARLDAERDPAFARRIFLALCRSARMPETEAWMRDVCCQAEGLTPQQERKLGFALSDPDRNTLYYEVALRVPELARDLAAARRLSLERTGNPDRLAEFDFIAPAVDPDPAVRRDFFLRLSEPEGREVEPWASRALSLLSHPLRGDEAFGYLAAGLDLLPEIQRTGDIFFPTAWCRALTGSHSAETARVIVRRFLEEQQGRMHPLLLSKVRQQADLLLRGI